MRLEADLSVLRLGHDARWPFAGQWKTGRIIVRSIAEHHSLGAHHEDQEGLKH
jgi:hypothetical protein